MLHVLVTGGSGGIGLGLIGHCLKDDRIGLVTATYRKEPPKFNHPRLIWRHFDSAEPEAYASLLSEFEQLDWLINTIGILHDEETQPEKTIKRLKSNDFIKVIGANTLPTLMLAQHAAPLLSKSTAGIFLSVSAKVGSISDNGLGGWYSYRASKAALNMALKTLSIEWQRTLPRVCVAAYHPGTTNSRLSAPFQSGVPAEKLFTSDQSGLYLYRTIQKLRPELSGKFWSWNGDELPW